MPFADTRRQLLKASLAEQALTRSRATTLFQKFLFLFFFLIFIGFFFSFLQISYGTTVVKFYAQEIHSVPVCKPIAIDLKKVKAGSCTA